MCEVGLLSPHSGMLSGPQPATPAVVLKLHDFQDKAWIMQEVRRAQSLDYKSAQIMMFEDFSAAVERNQQEFY